mmetsp:Transcript_1349/g.4602  ORF Transcript_1349/g.4602 Transcript_1349/m.4602 type:complete len:94 (-) Transcript_1349:307-588(-)
MLNIFAKISPKAEFFAQAKGAILEVIDRTRAEEGCKIFVLHEDGDGHLFLYEEWEDAAALARHYEEAYIKAIFENYKEWLPTDVEITKMTKCS